jgi:hypothetical protein
MTAMVRHVIHTVDLEMRTVNASRPCFGRGDSRSKEILELVTMHKNRFLEKLVTKIQTYRLFGGFPPFLSRFAPLGQTSGSTSMAPSTLQTNDLGSTRSPCYSTWAGIWLRRTTTRSYVWDCNISTSLCQDAGTVMSVDGFKVIRCEHEFASRFNVMGFLLRSPILFLGTYVLGVAINGWS